MKGVMNEVNVATTSAARLIPVSAIISVGPTLLSAAACLLAAPKSLQSKKACGKKLACILGALLSGVKDLKQECETGTSGPPLTEPEASLMFVANDSNRTIRKGAKNVKDFSDRPNALLAGSMRDYIRPIR
jgi:hypothetical protein